MLSGWPLGKLSHFWPTQASSDATGAAPDPPPAHPKRRANENQPGASLPDSPEGPLVSLTKRRVGLPGAFEVNAPRPGSNSQ